MAEGDPLVRAALTRALPTVVVDQPYVEGVPFVGIDDRDAARAAAEHLLGLGHRRFGVVSFRLIHDGRTGLASSERQRSAVYRVCRARLEGYAAALSAANIPWSDVPVFECPGSSKTEGRDATLVLLSRAPRPSAILALSDQLALGEIEAAKDAGLAVPRDLSVVGFDDVPEAAQSHPPLTTVYQDHAEKGRLAGRLLIGRLRGERPESPPPLATRLVVRHSTAPPAEV